MPISLDLGWGWLAPRRTAEGHPGHAARFDPLCPKWSLILLPVVLTLSALQTAYANGASPLYVVEEIVARIEAATDPAIFIAVKAFADLRAEARALLTRKAEGL